MFGRVALTCGFVFPSGFERKAGEKKRILPAVC
jgi:hypothetical protein